MRGLLATIAVLLIWPQAPDQDASADDIAIYQAVIEHTIRPEVIRFAKGAGIERPMILVVNRTLAVCEASRRVSLPHSCLMDGAVQSFEKPLRDGAVIFDDLVQGPVRAELGKSLLSRNDRNYAFPSLGIAGLLLADPELYATYFCGGGCGSGWLFLLERRDSSWRVQSRHMVWIA